MRLALTLTNDTFTARNIIEIVWKFVQKIGETFSFATMVYGWSRRKSLEIAEFAKRQTQTKKAPA